MIAAVRHRLPLLAAAALAALQLAPPAAARTLPRGTPRIVFIRCSSVPFPCEGRSIVTRTGQLLVGAGGMSRSARVVFPVRPAGGGRAVRKAVRGVFRTPTRIVVRVPGNAVSGRIWVVNPGRKRSNAVRITVRRPPAPPVGPPPSGVPSALDGNGMWIWVLGSSQGGDPVAIGAQAHAHGIGTVYLKSADGVNVWSQFSAENVAALKAQGLHVCAWQFVYGDDPIGEAQAAAAGIAAGADCFVIDAEGAYEGRYAQAQQYLVKLRELIGPAFPVALTSFPYVDYHPGLPFSVFLGPGGATFNLPQVYWKAIGDPVDTALTHTYTWNTPYETPIYPLGQAYDNPSSASIVRFRQVSASYGARGVSWWVWQHASDANWDAIGTPFTPLTAPPAQQWPTLKAGTGGKVGSKGDIVVWAQEHLAGAGQAITVDGQYGGGTATAVASFQASAGLPQTGQVDAATWPALLAVTPVFVDWTKPAPSGAAARAASGGGANGPASASLPARRDEVPPALGAGG